MSSFQEMALAIRTRFMDIGEAEVTLSKDQLFGPNEHPEPGFLEEHLLLTINDIPSLFLGNHPLRYRRWGDAVVSIFVPSGTGEQRVRGLQDIVSTMFEASAGNPVELSTTNGKFVKFYRGLEPRNVGDNGRFFGIQVGGRFYMDD